MQLSRVRKPEPNQDRRQDLLFVFLGATLPSYAKSSMKLAVEMSGCEITLIGSSKISRQVRSPEVNFIALEDFYDPTIFSSVSRAISSPSAFNNGFWLKTAERFFVLHQLASALKKSQFLHAELDQVLFRVDKLAHHISESGQQGLFFPFHTSRMAIASVFYCNSNNALDTLIAKFSSVPKYSNEMELLALWSMEHERTAFELPSGTSLVGKTMTNVSIDDYGGIVDAAQLGQWVGGIDPRIVPITNVPETHFSDNPHPELMSLSQLKKLRFRFEDGSANIRLEEKGGRDYNLYNLHLHSKIHTRLLKDSPPLAELLSAANLASGSRIPGTRRVQVFHFAKGIAQSNPKEMVLGARKLSRKVLSSDFIAPRVLPFTNQLLRRRPGSAPFISGDTFRGLADHVVEDGSKPKSITVKQGDIIFCETHMLDRLLLQINNDSYEQAVLILGNSDCRVDTALLSRIPRPRFPHLFAQNLNVDEEATYPLPIGLENAWRSNHGRTSNFHNGVGPVLPRIAEVMWTFNVATNPDIRGPAALALGNATVARHIGAVSPANHRSSLRRYSFVACPPGNGDDTHRAWEAMYLGCIPVLLRSPMTVNFDRMGLPVRLVESYDSLSTWSRKEVELEYQDLSNRFESPVMWSAFWIAWIEDCREDLLARAP